MAQMVKNPPAVYETWVQSPDREDPLETGMATHSSILAERILMDRGVSWDIIRDCKESDAAEHTHNYKVLGFLQLRNFLYCYCIYLFKSLGLESRLPRLKSHFQHLL